MKKEEELVFAGASQQQRELKLWSDLEDHTYYLRQETVKEQESSSKKWKHKAKWEWWNWIFPRVIEVACLC